MDAEKLKLRIREALGAAGIPREITQQVERIINSEVGDKDDDAKPRRAARARDDDEDEDDDAEHRAAMARAAESRAKPALRTTKAPRKKK